MLLVATHDQSFHHIVSKPLLYKANNLSLQSNSFKNHNNCNASSADLNRKTSLPSVIQLGGYPSTRNPVSQTTREPYCDTRL